MTPNPTCGFVEVDIMGCATLQRVEGSKAATAATNNGNPLATVSESVIVHALDMIECLCMDWW
jgi:hypothetical protein